MTYSERVCCSAKVSQRLNINNTQRAYKLIRRDKQLNREIGKFSNRRIHMKNKLTEVKIKKDRKIHNNMCKLIERIMQMCNNEAPL